LHSSMKPGTEALAAIRAATLLVLLPILLLPSSFSCGCKTPANYGLQQSALHHKVTTLLELPNALYCLNLLLSKFVIDVDWVIDMTLVFTCNCSFIIKGLHILKVITSQTELPGGRLEFHSDTLLALQDFLGGCKTKAFKVSPAQQEQQWHTSECHRSLFALTGLPMLLLLVTLVGLPNVSCSFSCCMLTTGNSNLLKLTVSTSVWDMDSTKSLSGSLRP
jgi:hypothetical protein